MESQLVTVTALRHQSFFFLRKLGFCILQLIVYVIKG